MKLLHVTAWVSAALILVSAAAYFAWPQSKPDPVASTTGSTIADECKVALGYEARTAADIAWPKACTSALTPPIPGQPQTTPPAIPPTPGAPTPGAPTPAPAPPPAKPPVQPGPAAPPGSGCIANPGSCGFPTASNTGPEAGVKLTAYSGPSTITAAGTVIQNVTTGCLTVQAANVTIRNVEIRCSENYSVDSAGSADSTGTTTVEHVRVICTGHGGTAFGDNRMAIRWADISHCENGGDADGNFSITDSYIHDMFLGDSVAPEPHTDGIQVWPGAQNIVFSHNSVLMHGANAAFTSGWPNGAVAHLTIERNLLDGGNYTVYCSNNVGSLSGNRLGLLGTNHQSPFGLFNACSTMTVSGNIDDKTGRTLAATA